MRLRIRSGSPERRSVALVVGLAVSATVLAACGSGGAGSDSGGGTVKIAVAAGATSFASVYVAQERGYFKDAGVDVELMDNAGANAVPMLASKQADLAFSGVPAALALGQKRPTKVVLAMHGGFSAAALVAGPGIDDLADLKGKKIGTPGTGTTSDAYANIYNKRLNLGANIVPFTTPVALVAAVKSGQVDAGTGTASLYSDIIANGSAHVILKAGDPQMEDVLGVVKYPEAVLFGLADTVGAKSDDVVKVLSAIQRASREMKAQDPAATTATITKTTLYGGTPPDVLTKNLAYDIDFILSDAGEITEDDWTVTLKQFRDGGVLKGGDTPAGVSYDNLIDMSYLKQAQEG
jgi:ABC-type nitrate/sulfonate/bicarbonate transport system substrate-binding protein